MVFLILRIQSLIQKLAEILTHFIRTWCANSRPHYLAAKLSQPLAVGMLKDNFLQVLKGPPPVIIVHIYGQSILHDQVENLHAPIPRHHCLTDTLL